MRAIWTIGSSAKWSTRWSAAVRAAYPRLSHRYYALKAKWFGKKTAAALGPQRAAAAGRAAHGRLDGGHGHGAHCLRRVLAENGRDRRAVFQKKLDRCAGAARQGAGRVCPSDRAVGTSLCAAQLSRQAARRDDARPRAWPRRASGAGRAQRRADGADAAHARGDRERVRRDAHVSASFWPTPRARKSARPCSPPRWRT